MPVSHSQLSASSAEAPRSIWLGDIAILCYIALATVVMHAVTGGRYGFHRDELYFLDSGRHLAASYVDQPIFSPLIARLSLELFGVSLMGLRLWPSLAAAGTVVLGGLLA